MGSKISLPETASKKEKKAYESYLNQQESTKNRALEIYNAHIKLKKEWHISYEMSNQEGYEIEVYTNSCFQ